MLEKPSTLLSAAIAEALENLEGVADLVVAVERNMDDPIAVRVLVTDALAQLEHAMLALNLEGCGPDIQPSVR